MKILIQSPVEHDGEYLQEGTIATIEDAQAQALLDAGVAIQVVAESKKAKAAAETPAE